MLAGEPGIGKTRTAQELAALAETQGAQVLWGRCYEEGGTPPYWPWLQTLNSYINRCPPEQLQAETGPGASAISEIAADLRAKLPDIKLPPILEPEQARFRLFSAISFFLKNMALSQPLLLVLDDLHWADRSSLQLLEFLAREIPTSPMLLLGTYRDVEVSRRHPLSETLGSLIREQSFQRLQLSGLAQPEVELLLRSSIGGTPTPGLLAAVQQRSEGNPLFVGEIVRMLAHEGVAEDPEVLTNIPEGIRDAIGRRLNRLTEECNQVLTTASVIGREFELRQLNTLIENMSEEQILEVLEEALAARVIDELPQFVASYQFTHALIRETLVDELSTTRRVRLSAQIAAALESLYSDDLENHAAELVHHFAEAETVLGPEKVVQYSLLAGERALDSYAFENALVHFQRGLATKGGRMDDQAADLWFGLGRAQAATAQAHEMAEAIESLTRAFEHYSATGDSTKAVTVAAYPFHTTALRIPSTVELIGRGLALLPEGSPATGSLLTNYGSALFFGKSDHVGAQEAFARAMAIARQEGDLVLETKILTAEVQVNLRVPRLHQEGIQKGLRAIGLAQQIRDTYSELIAHYYTGHIFRAIGNSEEGLKHAHAALTLAENLRDRYWLAGTLRDSQMDCQLRGEWNTAREVSERGLSVSPMDPRLLRMRTMLEYQVGEFEQGELYLELSLEVMRQSIPSTGPQYSSPIQTIPRIVLITGEINLLTVAEEAFADMISSPSGRGDFQGAMQGFRPLVSIIRKDIEAASEQYIGLRSLRDLMLGDTPRDRILGLLACTAGDLDSAIQHFEDALAFCRRAGYRPELAWCCSDYADTLLQRNNPGDANKARILLDDSLAISTELCMRPLKDLVLSRLDTLASSPTKAPSYPDGLTRREVEVLQLLALGKSNREIGDALVISEGTARRHVSNIYDKIGATNRAEATRYALTTDLGFQS